MNDGSRGPADRATILPEFTEVALTAAFDELPAGSRGTVVSVFPSAGTYLIEFFEPMRCFQTVDVAMVVRATVAPDEIIDWSGCDIVESVAGKLSGAPVLKGTRMPVQAIVDNYDAGLSPEELAETWGGITLAQVIAILKFARGTS